MRRTALSLCFALAVAGCGDFPRDAEGTLERIRAERTLRVGLIAPVSAAEPKVAALLGAIGDETGARPQPSSGEAETILKRLEEGEIDLAIGRFDKKTLWASSVDIGPPLRVEREGKREIHLAPAMRNGENAWVMLVERTVRDLAPEAQ